MNNQKVKGILSVLLRVAVAAAIFFTALLNYDRLSQIDMRALTDGAASILIAVLSVLGVYFVKSILFVIPAMLIYVSVGMAFPMWQALLINLAGICIEVTATYFLGRFLGGNAVEKKLSGKKGYDKLVNMKNKGKLSVVFGLRVLPVFPIDFTSLFLGASKLPFLPYLLMSVAGIMPRVVLFTLLGDKIYDYIPMRLIVAVVIAAIPLVLIAWFVKKAYGKKHPKSSSEDKVTAESVTEKSNIENET